MIYCFVIDTLASAKLMLLCKISRLGFIIGRILRLQLNLALLAPIRF